MGKKDKKKKDPKKQEAKKERKEAKAQKQAKKKAVKEGKEVGEEDIEAILAEFRAKEAVKTAVTIQECSQPSPRANFTLTTLPSSELLLFGGEYYDGEDTTCYNGVYRWNIEKNEWRQIESLNTPPPRCSHQAVCFRDHLYVFGGEFATNEQFYHYRDFWRLDLKTNQWEEIPLQKETPSARSGHRMVVWRNYIILYGGFYEAFRETKWFNDLFLFSLQDQKWKKIDYPAHVMVPAPRSGCQMSVSVAGDCVFVYGGYSKVKQPDKKSEGKVHEDMWVLQLKNLPNGGNPIWEKVSRKGQFPSRRSGASMVTYKTIAMLFGGVLDVEGKQHTMDSVFYADLYQFDMIRKRWYEVKLRAVRAKTSAGRRKKDKSKGGEEGEGRQGDRDEGDETDEEEEGDKAEAPEEHEKGFAFIDQDGNVVYLDVDEDEDEDEAMQEGEAASSPIPEEQSQEDVRESVQEEAFPEAESGGRREGGVLEAKTRPQGSDQLPLPPPPPPPPGKKGVGRNVPEEKEAEKGVIRVVEDTGGLALVDPEGRPGPLPRINPAITMRSHLLYVYGGVFEEGDREFTLDDCWCLDLNKREKWQCLLPGTMHLQVWKGETDTEADEDEEGSDDSSSDDDEEDEGGSSSSEDEEGGGGKMAVRQPSGDAGDILEISGSSTSGKKGGGKSKQANTIRAEIEALRDQLHVDDVNRTPQLGESLRDWFARTTEYWTRLAVDAQQAKGGEEGLPEQITREKEYKRLAFSMAQARYEELRPMLDRLNELEQQQRDAEERQAAKAKDARGRSKKERR